MYSAATSPSFSPPSSPFQVVDSSPPPSPVIGFSRSPSLQHPFAASAKTSSEWQPPIYEKKYTTRPCTPNQAPQPQNNRHHHSSSESTPYRLPFAAPHSPIKTAAQEEADVWSWASENVFDTGHGLVKLDGCSLTEIPQCFIHDLAKFYIPPKSFERPSLVTTWQTPRKNPLDLTAALPTMNELTRSFTRTQSAAEATFGVPREDLQLHLGTNMISFLPPALFDLQNLTLLSLRNNKIKYIPPEIVHLRNLKALNIANNELEFLPAEMLQMKLMQLQLFPGNYFITPDVPPHICQSPCSRSASHASNPIGSNEKPPDRRILSKIKVLVPNIRASVNDLPLRVDKTPSLVELCLRVLLSPAPDPVGSKDTTILQAYALPLDKTDPSILPPYLRKILKVCVPESLCQRDDSIYTFSGTEWWSQFTGVGTCPSPKHERVGQEKQPVFIRHAEEKFSWEKEIAQVDVGDFVPMKWRGCQPGCLDFLDDPEGLSVPEKHCPNCDEKSHLGECTPIGDEDVIQEFQFGNGELSFDT